MTERTEGWLLAAGAVLVAILAIGLRAWAIGTTPMWLDEAYSAYAAAHDFRFLWQVVPAYETHPPFYYSLLRLWTQLFGDGLFAERALGLAAGLLTLPVMVWTATAIAIWLGWELRRRRLLAFVTLALAAFSIPLVEMTREVRPYPLMILVYAVATRALVALLARRAAGKPLKGVAFTTYLVAEALLLWLHNLGPFWAAALGLAGLVALSASKPKPSDRAWFFAGQAAVFIVYLPALAILTDQAPTWVHSTWLVFSWAAPLAHLPVLYAVPGWQGLAAVMLLLLGGAALAMAARGRRLLAMLLLLGVVPTALSILVSATVAPVFISRTLTPVAVPTLLLAAIGAVAWARRPGWVGAGAAMILVANLLAVDLQARAGPPMQDWYRTLDWLAQRHRDGDLILAYPNEGALPLERALQDRGLHWRVRPVPATMPAPDEPGGWHPTGSRGVISLPKARLEAIARSPQVARVPRVWLLRLGAPTYDPGDMFLTALRRDRRETAQFVEGPIDIRRLEQPHPVGSR